MPLSQQLLAQLVCPSSGLALRQHGETLVAEEGGDIYPIIKGVPWLLPNPRNSLSDWGAKLNHFNQTLLSESKQIESDLRCAEGASQVRLQRLHDAKEAFIRRVSELLLPVVSAQASTKAAYDALRDRAPNTQNLLSYEANLYRDWVWGEDENVLTAQVVGEQLAGLSLKKLVVLGAGSGRLALDVHKQHGLEQTVATDINPLLVMAAEQIMDSGLSIVEFPLQPSRPEHVALEHEIAAFAKPEGFNFVFSDASQPCFRTGAFDGVLTPWFIDIQPLALGRFLRQLNQYVPVGGHWINFGSLVFNQNRDTLCYDVDEVKALAAKQGFEIGDIRQHEIPYLKSPYNAGYRVERVWSWRAEKIRDVKPLAQAQTLPAWLLNDSISIPKATFIEQFAFQHRIYAQLAAEVDGRTSLGKIARKVARQNKADEQETLTMLRKFFLDLYQQNA